MTPYRREKRRVGTAMRRVIEVLAAVDAPVERLAEVGSELEEIAASLEGLPDAEQVGYAEAATAPGVDSFMDRSPVLGQANPIAPPLHIEFGDGIIRATATFGSAYEGPPGCVHGGWIAASFDEVLGAAQSLGGSGGMTAYLKVDYRNPTPLHEPLRFEGELFRTEGRKIFTVGRLYQGEVLTAEAEALFITVDFARFAEQFGASRPD
ncbi:MAG: PaaI family thioesterase [Acidimicrobiales bacterium]|nr:PaaI family thioesterase [Acidimicrobiales bacterium]